MITTLSLIRSEKHLDGKKEVIEEKNVLKLEKNIYHSIICSYRHAILYSLIFTRVNFILALLLYNVIPCVLANVENR